jgi:hypothetical protein
MRQRNAGFYGLKDGDTVNFSGWEQNRVVLEAGVTGPTAVTGPNHGHARVQSHR